MPNFRRFRLPIAAAVVVATGGAVAALYSPSASATAWAPTGARLAVAARVAHEYATMTAPGGPGDSPQPQSAFAALAADAWPDNVQSVSFVEASRAVAAPLVHTTAAGDTSDVLVIRMVGSFVTFTTPPPPHEGVTHAGTASGKFLTVVVDASTGEIRDVALENVPAGELPAAAVTTFSR
jgi:hypothetical protein